MDTQNQTGQNQTGHTPTNQNLARRTILAAGLAAAGAGLLTPAPRAMAAHPGAAGTRRRVLRLAHLTDTHVQPERQGM